MPTTFPTNIDVYTNPAPGSNESTLSHSDQHANANDAILALETKVGIDGSSDTATLDYRVTALEGIGDAAEGGVYTPTVSNTSNVDGTNTSQCQYLRVGNVVTVSGSIGVTPSTPGAPVSFEIDLPVASNFSAIGNCGGSAVGLTSASNTVPIRISASIANDTAIFEYNDDSTSDETTFSFHFTYLVI